MKARREHGGCLTSIPLENPVLSTSVHWEELGKSLLQKHSQHPRGSSEHSRHAGSLFPGKQSLAPGWLSAGRSHPPAATTPPPKAHPSHSRWGCEHPGVPGNIPAALSCCEGISRCGSALPQSTPAALASPALLRCSQRAHSSLPEVGYGHQEIGQDWHCHPPHLLFTLLHRNALQTLLHEVPLLEDESCGGLRTSQEKCSKCKRPCLRAELSPDSPLVEEGRVPWLWVLCAVAAHHGAVDVP